MTLIFEQLVTSFVELGVGQSEVFLPKELALSLRDHLISLYDSDKMYSAGVGQNQNHHQDKTYRKDKISWLENSSENIIEIQFFKLINEFVLYLNESCFTGIQSHEFHYALYEKGSFYKKHIDQFSTNNQRVYSVIIYLNEHWAEGDGGELVLYKSTEIEKVSPIIGKMIFFDSAQMPHEVLETLKPRMSITGWLKR